MKKTPSDLQWVKKGAQQKHFRTRVKERLGFELSIHDWAYVLEIILTNEAEMLARPSNQTSMWRVRIAGKWVVVVFDDQSLEMVTVLTEEMWAERVLAKKKTHTDPALHTSIADTPAGETLQGMKDA